MRYLLGFVLTLLIGCSGHVEMRIEHKPKKAQFEVVGISANCLKCGKEFTVTPDEEGVVVLTTICPDCQRSGK